MKFYLTIFCLMNLITVVKSALLDIRPSTNIQAGAPTLTVKCQPTTASGVTAVYRLDILRLTEGVSTEQNLGNMNVGIEPELGPGLTNPKYTVTGSLAATNAVSTSFVQIVIQDPNCNDKDNPSNLGMIVVPSKLEYRLNDSISMSCNGNVGNPAKTWQWHTRRFPGSTQWFRYTDEADIVTDPVSPPLGSSCSYRQKTVLNYRVKAQDDGLQIRCILDNRVEFSKNFTINLVSSDIPSTSESNTQSNGSKYCADEKPLIVFGIFVGFFFVVYGIFISIIAGYLYRELKRDSRQKNESLYESVQHQPTIDSVYTSLDDINHLQTVTGNT